MAVPAGLCCPWSLALVIAAPAVAAATVSAAAASAASAAAAVAAATAAASAAPAASATTRPTAAALLTRTGLVDRQRTPPEGRVVEAIDRSLRFLVVVHDDEAEAARAARRSDRDHLGLAYCPVLPEQYQRV